MTLQIIVTKLSIDVIPDL